MRAVIVYLKEDEKLKLCLESLRTYSPEVEVDLIKVENPSDKTDALDELNKYLNSDKFVDDIIVWHPDMFATDGWYKKLQKDYDKFDVIGTKLLYPSGIVQHYGGYLNERGDGYHPHQGALNFGMTEPVSCAYVTGPGTVIKKHVVEKIGHPVFDPRFFKGYFGDTDFCMKARNEGLTVGVVPVEIIHLEGADSNRIRPQSETRELYLAHQAQFVAKWMHVLVERKCLKSE